MFYFGSKYYESALSQNNVVSKKIQILKDLDCFIIVDCKNVIISQPILLKIEELILDNVDKKDTYNKCLSYIHTFILDYKDDHENQYFLQLIPTGVNTDNTISLLHTGQTIIYTISFLSVTILASFF